MYQQSGAAGERGEPNHPIVAYRSSDNSQRATIRHPEETQHGQKPNDAGLD
jgi:hypothetical protein